MIGQHLHSFLIEEKIGSGAMGVVYRALHEKSGKMAAVKVITGAAVTKGKAADRFAREAEILSGFRHPNIVRYLGNGRFKGTNYLAMEYVTGGTLEEVLERRGTMPWKEVVPLAIDLCDALHYAHQRNVIHRDLKPSNLLLSDKGQIKLTDFGIAKALDADALTATGRTLGTAAYMAPEQIRGEPPVSHKTDLYSLGCLLFQMLTGQTPFQGPSPVVLMHMHLVEKPPRVSTKVPKIPRALDDLILNLMGKDPTKRPWDAEKVRADLAELKAKLDRGEEIPMAFAGGELPTRLGGPMAPTISHASAATVGIAAGPAAPTKASTKARKSQANVILPVDPAIRAERIKTIALAVTLAGLLGLLAYLLWPPGAQTLYRRAQVMMDSAAVSDWTKADREVLAELDRRFPDLYTEQKRAWRDKIGLEKANRRANTLEKPNLGRLSEPKSGPETLFVAVFNEAAGAMKAGDDAEAARKWDEMAQSLKGDDPEERPWKLLAQARAERVRVDMAERRKSVMELIARSDRLVQDGKLDDAQRLRQDIFRRFGKVLDLQDLFRDRARFDPATSSPSPPDDEPEPRA